MKALILSFDKLFAEALVCELKLAGIEAEHRPETPNDAHASLDQILVCDIDTVSCVQPAITFSRDPAKNVDFHRPFLTADLIASVRQRTALAAASTTGIQTDLLRISDGRAWLGSEEIPLTATESALLALLASRPGTPVSREEISRTVWGEDFLHTNRCEVYIRYLREKLERPDTPRRIVTVRGKGYMLQPAH